MIMYCQTRSVSIFSKKKTDKTNFFLSKSMPNFNFTDFMAILE